MSNSSVTVSVIMPVYNGEGYLRDCLDSVAAQTLRDIEIICVDDGSSDRSLSILDEYAAADPRIKIIAQQNSGAAVARNKGISIASGEYLSILDSDDIFEPRMLERMVAKARRTAADIVICRCDGFEDGSGAPIPMAWSLPESCLPKKNVFSRFDLGDALFTFSQGWAWDKLYLTSFVREHNLQFQNLRSSNDMLFTFLSLALARKMTIDSTVYVHQRRNRSTSISRTRQIKSDCFYLALLALRDELNKRGLWEETHMAFRNLAAHLSMWHFNTLCGHKESFFFLYDKLREEYLPSLGVGEQPPEQYLPEVRAAYAQCRKILELPVEEYLYENWLEGGGSASGNNELAEIKASSAYRVGRVVTWLPRMCVKGVRYIRTCGFSSAVSLLFKSISARFKKHN